MPFIDVVLHCYTIFYILYIERIYKIYNKKYNIYKGLKKSVTVQQMPIFRIFKPKMPYTIGATEV